MKKYTVLAIMLIILIILFVASMGIYFIKRDEIKANIFSDNSENTTVAEQEKENEDSEVKVIQTIGTGPKRPENYTVENGYEAEGGTTIIDELTNEELFISKYGEEGLALLIDNLKDENLKKEINSFISDSKTKLENEKDEFEKYIEEGNRLKGKVISQFDYEGFDGYDYYVFGPDLLKDYDIDTFQEIEKKPEIITRWSCINGYLSISYCYTYNYGENIRRSAGEKFRNSGVYDVCCATYDLYTGKKLQFSDLFFEGEDYSTEIYELMQNEIGKQQINSYIKREFTTLPQDYEYFTLDTIFFPRKNRYFSEGVMISHEKCCTIIPTATISRDMKDIFNSVDSVEVNNEYEGFRYSLRTTMIQEEISGVPFKVPKIKHWNDKIGEKINNNIEKYLKYLIDNDYFEKYALKNEKLVASNRSGIGNDVACGPLLSKEEELLLGLGIYYNSAYDIFSITLDANTGDVISFGAGMLIDYKMDENDRTKILEDLKKI